MLSKNIASLFAFTRKSQNNHRKWLRPPAHHPNMPSIEIKRLIGNDKGLERFKK